MGADFSASVVVGMRLSDFCEIRTLETTETRYDERSGEPYERKVKRDAVFILGVEVPGLDLSPDEWEETLGLQVWDMSSSYPRKTDLARCVMGIEIVQGSGEYATDPPIQVIDPLIVGKATLKVEAARIALYKRLGVPHLADAVPVQLFLLAQVSC